MSGFDSLSESDSFKQRVSLGVVTLSDRVLVMFRTLVICNVSGIATLSNRGLLMLWALVLCLTAALQYYVLLRCPTSPSDVSDLATLPDSLLKYWALSPLLPSLTVP